MGISNLLGDEAVVSFLRLEKETGIYQDLDSNKDIFSVSQYVSVYKRQEMPSIRYSNKLSYLLIVKVA